MAYEQFEDFCIGKEADLQIKATQSDIVSNMLLDELLEPPICKGAPLSSQIDERVPDFTNILPVPSPGSSDHLPGLETFDSAIKAPVDTLPYHERPATLDELLQQVRDLRPAIVDSPAQCSDKDFIAGMDALAFFRTHFLGPAIPAVYIPEERILDQYGALKKAGLDKNLPPAMRAHLDWLSSPHGRMGRSSSIALESARDLSYAF